MIKQQTNLNTFTYSTELVHQLEQQNVSPELCAEIKKCLLLKVPFVPENFNTFQLQDMLNYLEISHAHYLNHIIPRIEQTLEQLFKTFAVTNIPLRVLYFFLSRYKTNLIFHIEQEENVLFSFVKDLLNGNYSEKAKVIAVQHFLHTHNDTIILEVDELRNDLRKVDEELENNFVFRLLFNQLTELQEDLTLHGRIEDEVFVPMVLAYAEKEMIS